MLRSLPAVLLQLFGISILLAIAAALVSLLYVATILHEVLHPPRGGLAFALARRLPSEPASLGLPHRTFEVAIDARGPTGSSTTMPVWELSRSAASIDGPAADRPRLHVILLHGWGRSRIDSLGRVEPFLLDDASIYLPDLRGHGDSRCRTTLGVREVEDLDRLIATLAPGPVVLAGHSMGATIALRCAAHGAERARVRGVVAIAPYDVIRTPIEARLASRDLPRGIFLGLTMAELRRRGLLCESAVDAARSLTVPVLVLQGENDRISPAGPARAVAEAARATYVALPDVEHANHHDRHPERFESAIREFLRGLT